TSGLAVWKAATHASWAEPCDDAPPPTRVPESVLSDASAGAVPSLAAHEERTMVPARAMAAMLPRRLMFTEFLSGECDRCQGAGANAHEDTVGTTVNNTRPCR